MRTTWTTASRASQWLRPRSLWILFMLDSTGGAENALPWKRSGVYSSLCCRLAVCPRASLSPSLGPSSLSCEIRERILTPTFSEACQKEKHDHRARGMWFDKVSPRFQTESGGRPGASQPRAQGQGRCRSRTATPRTQAGTWGPTCTLQETSAASHSPTPWRH